MSAIAGILYFNDAPVESDQIAKLTKAMFSRGPDRQSTWSQRSIGLGHCMLHATPESLGERQPLLSEDSNFALVWDGRLDNRDELIREFKSRNTALRDTTDAEIVLHCYLTWGEKCPEKLLGDFVFAIWDGYQSKLFLARDHVGARPLYYTHNDVFIAFASEDEALLTLPGVSSNPNKGWIATMFVPAYEKCIDPCQSWVEGVRFLGSGQFSTVTIDGQINISTYWSMEPWEDSCYKSDNDYEEAFHELFNDAVRCRLRSIQDPAVMLSGGIDSASIATMMQDQSLAVLTQNLQTFSVTSDHPDSCIESRCIRKLTDSIGDRAHFLSVPSIHGMITIEDLVNFAWSNKKVHPVDDSVLLPAMMCLAAQRNGHRVILHGASGDLANHSPRRYQAYLLCNGHYRMAWQECIDTSKNGPLHIKEKPLSIYLKSFWSIFASSLMKRISYRVRGGTNKGFYVNDMIGRGLYEQLNISECLDRLVDEAQRDNLTDYMHTHIKTLFPLGIRIGLEAYDRVASRCGIEARDPWADKRVLEFMVNLPLQQKVRHGWTKYLARKKLLVDIDDGIRWRRDKEHLGWNLHMRLAETSGELFTNLFSDKNNPVYEYINPEKMLYHIKNFKEYREPGSADNCIWSSSLALWVNRLTRNR